jgi:hypothetical protein
MHKTTFGDIWQPIKPNFGNYRLRGLNTRNRKIVIKKIKNSTL